MATQTTSATAQTSTTAFRSSGPLPFGPARHTSSSRAFVPGHRRLTQHSSAAPRPERFTFCEDDLVDVDLADLSSLPDWQAQFVSRTPTQPSPAGNSMLSTYCGCILIYSRRTSILSLSLQELLRWVEGLISSQRYSRIRVTTPHQVKARV